MSRSSVSSIFASFAPCRTQVPKVGSSRNISIGPTKAAEMARIIEVLPEPFSPNKTCQPAAWGKSMRRSSSERMFLIWTVLMYIFTFYVQINTFLLILNTFLLDYRISQICKCLMRYLTKIKWWTEERLCI